MHTRLVDAVHNNVQLHNELYEDVQQLLAHDARVEILHKHKHDDVQRDNTLHNVLLDAIKTMNTKMYLFTNKNRFCKSMTMQQHQQAAASGASVCLHRQP